MVSMTDNLNYPKSHSCCIRKNATSEEVLSDGIYINILLVILYFGAYAIGFYMSSVAIIIAFLINTVSIVIVINETVYKNNENLSLKQREHGATKSRGLTDEQEEVLYEQLYSIVEETRRRNEARACALERTPTSSSLAETCEDDEYADMPDLMDAISINQNILRNRRRVNIFDYNTLTSLIEEYDDMPALVPLEPSIPVVREILEGSKSHILHNGMDDID
jgi:hypothetical protein